MKSYLILLSLFFSITGFSKPTRIVIAGGGPAGLMAGISLFEYLKESSKDVEIHIFEKRWVLNNGRMIWEGKRRDQVVTIQDEVQNIMPKNLQTELFHDHLSERVWARSNNIPIRDVEDKMLRHIQLLSNKHPGIIYLHIGDIKKSLKDSSNMESIVNDADVIISAEGAGSYIRDQYFDTKNSGINYALGISIHHTDLHGQLSLPLPQDENILRTLIQTRYLFNASDKQGCGYVNMLLTKEEYENVVDLNGDRCTFSNPGLLDSQLPNATTKLFKPYVEKTEFWRKIQDGLTYFGINKSAVKDIAAIRLSLDYATESVKEITLPSGNKTLAFLTGDANFSVHFWPGRGMNSGFKNSIAIAFLISKAIKNDNLNLDNVIDFNRFSEALRIREHNQRSIPVMESFGNEEVISEIVSEADEKWNKLFSSIRNPLANRQNRKDLKIRFSDIYQRVCRNSFWNFDQSLEHYHSMEKRLNKTLKKMSKSSTEICNDSGCWPIDKMSGPNVNPIFMIDDFQSLNN